MHKLLIVDDDASIRSGLIAMVPWEEFGIVVSGEADNGESALKLIDAVSPDIVITDIRMPKMTGLELIRQCRREGRRISFIIISGYDDFAYVKAAVRYNVHNYLLKPVSREELAQSLAEISTSRIREEYRAENTQIMRTTILNRLLNRRISHAEFREKAEFLNLDLLDSPLSLGIVQAKGGGEAGFPEDLLPGGMLSLQDREKRYVFIAPGEWDSRRWREALEPLLAHFLRTDPSTVLAVAASAVSYRDLHVSYERAVHILNTHFWDRGRVVLQETDLPDKEVGAPLIEKAKLMEALQALDKEAVKGILRSQLTPCAEARLVEKSRIFLMVVQILDTFLEVVRQRALPSYPVSEKILRFNENWKSFRTLTELLDWLDSVSDDFLGILTRESRDGGNRMVLWMKKTIRERFRESLSLKVLGAESGRHPAYLGRVFSEKTGYTFTEYLLSYRLKHAAELLRKTPYKISEIAGMVGFSGSENYFSTQFKNQFGVSPRNYKNGPEERAPGG